MSGLLPFHPGSYPANHRLSIELPFNLLHNPFLPAQVEVRGKQGNGIMMGIFISLLCCLVVAEAREGLNPLELD